MSEVTRSIREHSADTFYQLSYYYGNAARLAGSYLSAQLVKGAYRHATGTAFRTAYAPAARTASFLARAHVNAVRGVLGTTMVRGGTQTLGGNIARLSGAAVAGYALGATVGTLVSGHVFGHKGAEKALDLYMPGGASFIDEGIFGMLDNIHTIGDHYLS